MILESLIGTLAGFIGTGITTYSQYKLKKLELEEEKCKRAHELAMIRAESMARLAEVRANIEVTQVATEGAILLEEAKGFVASQTQGNKNSFESKWIPLLLQRQDYWGFLTIPIAVFICVLFGLSDAVKSFMRSALTLYSLAIATWITWCVWHVLQGIGIQTIDANQAIALWQQSMEVVYCLAVTLITWWFGDRRVAKHLMHLSQPQKVA